MRILHISFRWQPRLSFGRHWYSSPLAYLFSSSIQKKLAQALIVLSWHLIIFVSWLLSQGSSTQIISRGHSENPATLVRATESVSTPRQEPEYFTTHSIINYLSIRGRTITTVSNTSRYLFFNLNSLQRKWTGGWMCQYDWWLKNELPSSGDP